MESSQFDLKENTMDTCSGDSCLDSDWQATCLSLLLNLRNVLPAVPGSPVKIYQQVPKTLTTGAVSMIYVLLIFVFLAVAGSTITVFEFLLDTFYRKEKDQEENKLHEISTDKSWLNKFKTFISCFCILNNGRKVFEISSKKDQFECINGIRFLSNLWIMLAHICMGYMSSIRNVYDLKPMVEMWSSQLVLNGQYAVDAFFVLGGFLNAYLFFNNYDKSNGNVSWFYFYFKRFVRITPVYMVILGFYTFLFPYVGSGPIWPTFDTNPVCLESWWWNLLYINNFKHYTRQCMEWCWYLAADLQFYIVSPIFLVSLLWNPTFGYIFTGVFIAASCLASFIITKQNNLVDGFSRVENHFDNLNYFFDRYCIYFDLVYSKPYTRICSYLVAILLAHYLYKRKLEAIHSKAVRIFGWIATGILWFIAYFALFKREESIIENAVYNGIKHLIYSMGLSWIIFACLTGHGGLVNKYLSWKVFSPLAKLSYCAYLIHPIVLMKYYQTIEHLEDFSTSNLLALSAYVCLWTYVFSFMACLLFEFPFLNLLDWISSKNQMTKVNHS